MPKKNRFIPSKKSNIDSKKVKFLVMSVFEKNPEAALTHKHISELVGATDPNMRAQVFEALISFSKQKKLVQINHHTFKLGAENKAQTGILDITQRGFGFISQEGSDSDVFVAASNIGKAMHGDSVSFRLLGGRKGRPEGVVISVVERARVQFAGTVKIKNNVATLIPDNTRSGVPIQILETKLGGAQNGMKAIVKITAWPDSQEMPFGEVVALLGYPGTNDAEMISILVNQGFDPIFPQEVIETAERISDVISEEEISKRRDFRPVLTFTIDPVDAKDFDDAISYQLLENGNIELGVHIADVSHYVNEKSALDVEALKRCNSVYLVDRVMPMLPEQLSNVICSLRPHEDKLCFAACFEITSKGEIIKEWFGRTVIHSNRRFTYEEAQEIILGAPGDYENEIRKLDTLAKTFRSFRFKAGALNISSEEMRFKLDETGKPIETVIKRSLDAHQLIEEFMLLANQQVAKFLTPKENSGAPYKSVYRIHDDPDPEKLSVLSLFCLKFGFELHFDSPKNAAQSINALLQKIAHENEFPLIQNMVIRSMSKATYSTENIGHYGLAFKYYTHFTSPIRRYADLIVHRLLAEKIAMQTIRNRGDLDQTCKRISIYEKKATEAERESTKYFQTLLLIDHVGQSFDGIVSGLSENGMYVKLIENHCEGMVAYQSMEGDRYVFDSDKFEVKGVKKGKKYNLGDPVKVVVDQVSPRKRQIDLILDVSI